MKLKIQTSSSTGPIHFKGSRATLSSRRSHRAAKTESISIIWNLLRDSTVLEVRWCCFHMDFSNLFPGNCVWREAGISLHAFLPRGSLPPRLSVKPPFLPQEVRGSHLCGKSGDRAHGVCLQAFSCPGGLRAEVTRAR